MWLVVRSVVLKAGLKVAKTGASKVDCQGTAIQIKGEGQKKKQKSDKRSNA